MRYTELPPSPPLRRYVESYWHLQSGPSYSRSAADRIMPDGCIELIFNAADPFKRFHANGTIEIQPQILVAGQMRSYALIAPMGQIKLWGIRFRPGGAFAFLHVPLHELTDQILAGTAILGTWASELQERIGQEQGRRAGLKLIEAALLQRLHKRWQNDPAIRRTNSFNFPAGTDRNIRAFHPQEQDVDFLQYQELRFSYLLQRLLRIETLN